MKSGNFSSVSKVIGIVAGKGGVGKSTWCCQLARACQLKGLRVGILDADIHGPSMQCLAPVSTPARVGSKGVIPADSTGISIMSAAYLPKWSEVAAVRAPIANALIEQFLSEVEWGELDILFVDFPPGTGDIPITLLQKAGLSGIIAITTSQTLAVQDVRKALLQIKEAGIAVLGLVENMVGMRDPQGRWIELFGTAGGVIELLYEFDIPHHLQLPFDPMISALSDRGGHLFESAFSSPLKEKVHQFAEHCLEEVGFSQRSTVLNPILQDQEDRQTAWVEDQDTLGLCATQGSWRRIDIGELTQSCPCVACVSLRDAHALDSKESISRKCRKLTAVKSVGRFGVMLSIEGGCSRGIYPWTLLETLGSLCETNRSPKLSIP